MSEDYAIFSYLIHSVTFFKPAFLSGENNSLYYFECLHLYGGNNKIRS